MPAFEQPLRAVENALEHRLGVRHRAADHLQHLGSRGLVFQRLLGLVEQAHVLDGDHGLAGEGRKQHHGLRGKRPGFGARHADGTDRLALVKQGHRNEAAKPGLLRKFCVLVPGFELNVGNLHGSAFGDGAPHIERCQRERHGKNRAQRRFCLRRNTMHANQVHQRAVETGGHPEIGLAQHAGTLRDGVEDRLHIGGGTADHRQDVGGRGLLL